MQIAKRASIAGLVLLLALSVSARAAPRVESNVVYGMYSGLALLMDVYKPAAQNGLGIVIVNGSGWYRDLGYDAPVLKQSPEFCAAREKLLGAGYTVFVVTHRASPRFHIPEIVQDVQRATRFIRANAARWHPRGQDRRTWRVVGWPSRQHAGNARRQRRSGRGRSRRSREREGPVRRRVLSGD
jgi:hypothetical protein